MASMRKVRKSFRKEVLRLISSGDGNTENLTQTAGGLFGNYVGYEMLIKTFLQSEVSNAVATLRNEGLVETVGKKWKLAGALESEDVDIIHIRRLKRLRGELKAEIRLAHEHGRTNDAINASDMLAIVSSQLVDAESDIEAEAIPVA